MYKNVYILHISMCVPLIYNCSHRDINYLTKVLDTLYKVKSIYLYSYIMKWIILMTR